MIKVADITVLATTVLSGGGERCYLLFERRECLGGDDFRYMNGGLE